MALKTWESTFAPSLDASQWPEYNGDEYVPDCGLLKQKTGRRKRKRLRNEMDDSSKGYGEDMAMAHPDYPLLETFYDREHRAHLMVDDGEVLSPLRIHTHSPLRWDERYAPCIGRAGFLPLARLVMTGLPMFDNAALTALVDRWRSEIHTFHLPCGELMVTLQDVAMILGLPVDGQPVCGNVQPAGWRDMVELIVGTRPPEPTQEAKDKKPLGVSSAWLAQNFTECPHDAVEHVVERYARAWLWLLVGGYLFPDRTGNTVSWMYLPLLGKEWENVGLYSWGSATLAFYFD
ncbi:protein MAIN-LIKE 2-like [Phragmites australis]|uniref:protein MAIN-LIKE 2-like n=1 Tax=Phragmites australis TaxID=29695 RepID=UPI002D76D43F|nr:protein MAIN-LIKE 2-like [Phragmites australis]